MDCKICLRVYNSVDAAMTPRVLTNCGHTICEECSKKLSKNGQIICPFDRKPTVLKGTFAELPKNYSILEMLEDNRDDTLPMQTVPITNEDINIANENSNPDRVEDVTELFENFAGQFSSLEEYLFNLRICDSSEAEDNGISYNGEEVNNEEIAAHEQSLSETSDNGDIHNDYLNYLTFEEQYDADSVRNTEYLPYEISDEEECDNGDIINNSDFFQTDDESDFEDFLLY